MCIRDRGSLFTWKFSILLAVVVLSVVFYRPFCKWLCPLGAFYALLKDVYKRQLLPCKLRLWDRDRG